MSTAYDDLVRAIRSNNVSLVQEILQKDPSLIHAVDSNHWTALHWAASYGQTDVIDVLVKEYGAHVNCLTSSKDTPVVLAALKYRTDTVEKLHYDFGADLTITNCNGTSAVGYLCVREKTRPSNPNLTSESFAILKSFSMHLEACADPDAIWKLLQSFKSVEELCKYIDVNNGPQRCCQCNILI